MNINVGDYLLAIDEIDLYDDCELNNMLFDVIEPFEIFKIFNEYNNFYTIIIYNRVEENIKCYYVRKEDLKGKCVKLKIEEI